MPEQPGKPGPLLAMVALNTPSLPPPKSLLGSLKATAGITLDLNSVQVEDQAIIFGLGKDNAVVGLMPAPIPWSNLEGPCATAWWWPDATERMKKHNSHILVALTGGVLNPIQRYIMLTHLVAAVASHTDAAGIYWGSGTLVHDPQVFIEQAHDLSPDNLPLPLWIDFRVVPNDDGSNRLFTTGMKAFNQTEIEIPNSQKQPAEIFNFACAIAEYIITSHAEIRDGETVGRSETERIRATHAPSMCDPAVTVLRLDF